MLLCIRYLVSRKYLVCNQNSLALLTTLNKLDIKICFLKIFNQIIVMSTQILRIYRFKIISVIIILLSFLRRIYFNHSQNLVPFTHKKDQTWISHYLRTENKISFYRGKCLHSSKLCTAVNGSGIHRGRCTFKNIFL